MPLQATSGAASYDAFGGGVAAVPNYIEDVFSTYLYTGNAGSQNIVNGIDLSTKGGMVWIKDRTQAASHYLQDTVRGANNILSSNNTNAQSTLALNTVFNTDGFSQNNSFGGFNGVGDNYVSWTFREAPKFFDVVTYSGNNGVQNIAHNLGSVPGCIIVKETTGVNNWFVYHKDIGTDAFLLLETTNATISPGQNCWNNTAPTSTQFTVGSTSNTNGTGSTYVAYLFAHDAGGFGLTGTDNVISCGSYTGSNSSAVSVNLGYEPQWVMIKRTDSSGSPAWWIGDTMRGLNMQGINRLEAWTSNAESAAYNGINPTATGFVLPYGTVLNDAATSNYIYIAIRRGPMKVPTSGTSVFNPVLGRTANPNYLSGFPVDFAMSEYRVSGSNSTGSRLQGSNQMDTASTGAEASDGSLTWDFMNGYYIGGRTTDFVSWMFRRAPSFFDVVCYTGTGTYGAANHNLGVTPELVIYKSRSNAVNWGVIKPVSSIAYYDGLLNSNSAFTYYSNDPSVAGLYTSTQFCKYQDTSSYTYVAYLFATCAGVSKVGNYTGNGSTQTINCGFGAGGARLVLIKRTDSTGDWYVYDTARGMTVLTDPYLLLNQTVAETATLGSVTTVSTGFAVNASILAAINTNAASYIFLAIA